MYYSLAWVAMLIAFGILEGMTASLVSIWFCIAALVALIATVLGASIGVQIGIFAVVSVLCIALIRPFAKSVLKPADEKTKRRSHFGCGSSGDGTHQQPRGKRTDSCAR